MADLFKITNLCKSYTQGLSLKVPVINDLNLEISSGDFISLMGASGSGKSTLLNLLGLLDSPNSGGIIFNNINIIELSSNEKAFFRNREFGFVFQGFNLLKRISILDNVALPLLYQGVERKIAKKDALKILNITGLNGLETRLPNQLSGGQQQRVAIARALVVNPRVILADEPTGNLDSKTAKEIMNIFVELNKEKGITVILVTHEFDIAQYSNRLIKMIDGRIVTDEINKKK